MSEEELTQHSTTGGNASGSVAEAALYDLPVRFTLLKSAIHAGFTLVVSAGAGESYPVADHINTPIDALTALVGSLTAPLVSEERISALEAAIPTLSDLLDRVTALEQANAALDTTLNETRDALIRMMAGGPARVVRNDLAVDIAEEQANTRKTVAAMSAEQPGFAVPGMAGTFRRPLSESVHAAPGQFPGGAFRRSSLVEQAEASASPQPFGEEQPTTPPTQIQGGVIKR